MEERKVIIKTGLNLENSYTSLPEIFFTRQNPKPCTFTKISCIELPINNILGTKCPSITKY